MGGGGKCIIEHIPPNDVGAIMGTPPPKKKKKLSSNTKLKICPKKAH